MANKTTASEPSESSQTTLASIFSLRYENYPILYTVKILLTLLAVLLAVPCYRHFPLRVSWLAVAVGAFGILLWVGICQLQLEPKIFGPLGLGGFVAAGERPAFNPFDHFDEGSIWLGAFLAVRFAGLVLLVPVVEEFFYRGFLMRVVMQEVWWKVPIGQASRLAIAMGTLFPALAHPSELLAAVAWFGMVTWLLLRTRNIWDCVAAHAVTNLLLGIYVVTQEQWQLW